MTPEMIPDSMLEALADKLAPKLLAGMQESFDLSQRAQDESIRRVEKVATGALIAACIQIAFMIGWFAAQVGAMIGGGL